MDLGNWKDEAREKVRPVILTLDRWGFSPLAVTIVGLVISLAGAWLVAEGHLFLGTLIFLLGSAFDMLDGGLARLQGTASQRGAFLDSVLDRFGEAAYLTGIAIYWMGRGGDNWERGVILVLVTMFGSLATSYVRARAEGLGETCYVGVLQRTERVIALGIGALLGPIVLYGMLWVLAILTLVTTFQRIAHVAGKLPGPDPEARRETVPPAPATASEPEPSAVEPPDKLEPKTPPGTETEAEWDPEERP